MYIIVQFISGFLVGFELLSLKEIGLDDEGWVLAVNLGIIRVCFESSPS
jgi:hypothetical protein